MAFPKPPPRPAGTGPAAVFMQSVWDAFWSPEHSLFVPGPGFSADKRDGQYLVKVKGGRGGSSSSVTNIRGEYDPTATYQANDITVISMGANQGTFACLQNGTSGISPTTGAPNWMQLPGGLLGVWM